MIVIIIVAVILVVVINSSTRRAEVPGRNPTRKLGEAPR